MNMETVRGWGLGYLIAFIVLILCIIAWFIGKPLTGPEILGLIGALALSRLL
jgi:hypothetical protein